MLNCPECDRQFTDANKIGHSEHTCEECGTLLQWHRRYSAEGGGIGPLMTLTDPQRCLPTCVYHRLGALVPTVAAECRVLR